MTDKVKIETRYLKPLDCHVYIVYSQCGRFSERFYDDPTAAIECASEEYLIRLEHEKFLEQLDRW